MIQRLSFTSRAHAGRQARPLHASPSSLVPQTLKEMESSTEQPMILSREEMKARQRALEGLGIPSFSQACMAVSPLNRSQAKTLQLNIGLYCNQACTHCHVESSPKRTEMMSRETADACIRLMTAGVTHLKTVDLTGGAPELNAQFRHLVLAARGLGMEVIDRCNLTVLLEPGQEDLASVLADNRVHVIASLPCYSTKNVDQQRGAGVFERSIQALKMLNRLGYGVDESLKLDLVYNPSGAFLSPSQSKLEPAYKQELAEAHGIVFNNLFCLNNMPIKRFADMLIRRNQLDDYMSLLASAFNPSAAEGVMCRDTVSVGWDGKIYDCDFNQQLDLPIDGSSDVHELSSLEELTSRRIVTGPHCYGCTAGEGSSCGGQVAAS